MNNKQDLQKLPLRQRQAIVDSHLQIIYTYPYWDEVLKELDLEPAKSDFTHAVSKAANASGFGGGESDDHKRLKKYVAKNPQLFGLPANSEKGSTEYKLPSGDLVDVWFATKNEWVAVEVKSKVSGQQDIVRGFFQCIKYQAVADAVLKSESKPQSARAILVLESELPTELLPLCNVLGIEVKDGIKPSS